MAVLFFGVCGIISYMASKEDFKRATEQLNFDEDAQVAYMSNPANWLAVHCTVSDFLRLAWAVQFVIKPSNRDFKKFCNFVQCGRADFIGT